MENLQKSTPQNIVTITGNGLAIFISPDGTLLAKDTNGKIASVADILAAGGDVFDQNNIDIVMVSNTNTTSLSRLVDTVTSTVNLSQPYTISDTQSLWYVFLFNNGVTLKYKLLNKGKGTYGSGGTEINYNDLLLVSSSQTTATDIEMLPTTQVFEIEDLEGMDVSDYVNQISPPISVQNQEDGYVIFKTGDLENLVTYLFTGAGGNYGAGSGQTTESQFEVLNQGGSSGGSSDQNNIDIFRTYNTNRTSGSLLSQINNSAEFEISEVQSLWIKEFKRVASPNDETYTIVKNIYKVVNKGKGTYGTGSENPLVSTDLELISTEAPSVQDIEDNPETEIFNTDIPLGENISEFVNSSSVPYEIQPQDQGYTIFKNEGDSGDISYLFLGAPGLYGTGQLQTVISDFQVLNEQGTVQNAIAVKNSQGNVIFYITNEFTISGASLDPDTNTISIDALVPLAAFLDVVNGNDSNAAIENSAKPFKTIAALFAALPATAGETYTIYIKGGTVDVTRRVPGRNLIFVAYTATILDFTNCMEDNGTTSAINVQRNVGATSFNYHFENSNISIICNYVGVKSFSYIGNAANLVITGNIDVLDWDSYGAVGADSFCLAAGSEFKVNKAYDSSQNAVLLGGTYSAGQVNVEIDNFFVTYGQSLSQGKVPNVTVNKITKNTSDNLNFQLRGYNLRIGDIDSQNTTISPFSDTVEFFGTISSSCKIELSGTRYISGTVVSTLYLENQYLSALVTQVYENFTGKLRNLRHGGATNAKVLFKNVDLTVDRTLLSKSYDSNTDIATFQGFNTITQLDTTAELFETESSSNVKTIEVKIDGSVKTNALSFGKDVKSIYPNATFKEKLKEITVRSKRDLVNRVLDPEMNYIIDGIIDNLLSSDRIIVPVGGLSLQGYGFDVSAIKALSANSIIFESPTGGCGNIFLSNISFTASGGNSKVFSATNAGAPTGGADAVELNVVNFDNCDSLGELVNFRQGLWNNVGIFGVRDGLTLSGVWSGGFRSDLTIVRNFGIASTVSTLFKAGTGLLFKSRFWTDINADFKASGSLSDFAIANFDKPNLYQIKGAQATRNNVIDATQNYTGTITPFDSVSDWQGNNGIPNSRLVIPNAILPNQAVALGQVQTEITIIPDTTVALVASNLRKYYGLTGTGTIASLPPISGNEGNTLIMANKSASIQDLFSNDGTSNDIFANGVAVNTLSMPIGFVGVLFNDTVNWILL